jgi:putative membrane protein
MRWNGGMFGGQHAHSRAALTVVAILAAALVALIVSRADARTEQVTLDDAQIVAIFDLANTADIETGRLGSERAQHQEVKDYGTMLTQVHTQVRKNGRALAAKLGVRPSLPAGDKSAEQHAATMERLGKLSGAEFDLAFVRHEKAFHAAVLSAVKSTLLPAIQNQELKDFVTSLAPAFEAHLLAAENLERKLTARGN